MGVSFALALLMVAVLIVVFGLRLRRRTGLPWAPILYQDTGGRTLEQPLYVRHLGLTGKPDYLLELRGYAIPVEVKPGRYAIQPYESDLMQLAAYCVLVEETQGLAPPYGLLRYAERTFRLDYTPQVREDLLTLLDEMRAYLAALDCDRSHDDVWRCESCGFCTQCEEALL